MANLDNWVFSPWVFGLSEDECHGKSAFNKGDMDKTDFRLSEDECRAKSAKRAKRSHPIEYHHRFYAFTPTKKPDWEIAKEVPPASKKPAEQTSLSFLGLPF